MIENMTERTKDMLRKKEAPEKLLLSVKEVCELTGLSEKTIRNLIEENHLLVRIGRRTLVDRKNSRNAGESVLKVYFSMLILKRVPCVFIKKDGETYGKRFRRK